MFGFDRGKPDEAFDKRLSYPPYVGRGEIQIDIQK